jgi:hypothetical protein
MSTKKQDRNAKVSAALKANLKKRKDQSKARTTSKAADKQ